MLTIVETPLFTRLVMECLDDERYANLQEFLSRNPEAGALVPRSGGVRKLRWRAGGRGKRGGLRVIYYLRLARDEIWMLTIYPKNVRAQIPAHVLKQLRKAIDDAEEA
jgi:mRNA-degrading endonuclease RelE of RelBE toxin-antitoxin system